MEAGISIMRRGERFHIYQNETVSNGEYTRGAVINDALPAVLAAWASTDGCDARELLAIVGAQLDVYDRKGRNVSSGTAPREALRQAAPTRLPARSSPKG